MKLSKILFMTALTVATASAQAGYIIAGDSISKGVIRSSVVDGRVQFHHCEGIELNCGKQIGNDFSDLSLNAGKALERSQLVAVGVLHVGAVGAASVYGIAVSASRLGVMNIGAVNGGWATAPMALAAQSATVSGAAAVAAGVTERVMSMQKSLNVLRLWDFGQIFDMELATSDQIVAFPDDSLAEVISTIEH